MFLRRFFDVLVVDDEQDVLKVSQIALKNVHIDGIPLRVHTRRSKAEAIEFCNTAAPLSNLAAAVVDVVMESDEAGLELCQYVRETMKNKLTQLIIRTGQPGRYPEIEVIDRYDISGYVTKSDATDVRLYSLIKTSIRQYEWSRTALMFYQAYSALIAGFRSPPELLRGLRAFFKRINHDAQGRPLESVETHLAILLNEHQVTVGRFEEQGEIERCQDNLKRVEAVVLGEGGDTFRVAPLPGGGVDVSLRLGQPAERKGGRMPNVELLAYVQSPPPDFVTTMWVRLLYSVRRLFMISEFVDNAVISAKLGGLDSE